MSKVEIAPEARVSARRAAELVGKVERTIRRWIEKGTLPAERDTTSGEFRIRLSDLAAVVPADSWAEQIVEAEPEKAEPTGAEIEAYAKGQERGLAIEGGWIERAARAEARLEVAVSDFRQLARLAGELKGDQLGAIVRVLAERWV